MYHYATIAYYKQLFSSIDLLFLFVLHCTLIILIIVLFKLIKCFFSFLALKDIIDWKHIAADVGRTSKSSKYNARENIKMLPSYIKLYFRTCSEGHYYNYISY